MIEPEFLLELLIILLDLPARLGDLHQASKTVITRQIAEEIPRRLRGFFRPLDQQPDLFEWLAALVKSMRRLHPERTETRLQPTFAAFPPANVLPALGLLRSFFDRDGPLLTIVRRTWRTPRLLWFQFPRTGWLKPNSRGGLYSHSVRQFAFLQLFTKSCYVSIARIRDDNPLGQFPSSRLVDHL